MKTYDPIIQQVLDETAVERQFITNHFKAVRENAELKEICNELLITLQDCAESLERVANENGAFRGRCLMQARVVIAKTTNQLSKIK